MEILWSIFFTNTDILVYNHRIAINTRKSPFPHYYHQIHIRLTDLNQVSSFVPICPLLPMHLVQKHEFRVVARSFSSQSEITIGLSSNFRNLTFIILDHLLIWVPEILSPILYFVDPFLEISLFFKESSLLSEGKQMDEP